MKINQEQVTFVLMSVAGILWAVSFSIIGYLAFYHLLAGLAAPIALVFNLGCSIPYTIWLLAVNASIIGTLSYNRGAINALSAFILLLNIVCILIFLPIRSLFYYPMVIFYLIASTILGSQLPHINLFNSFCFFTLIMGGHPVFLLISPLLEALSISTTLQFLSSENTEIFIIPLCIMEVIGGVMSIFLSSNILPFIHILSFFVVSKSSSNNKSLNIYLTALMLSFSPAYISLTQVGTYPVISTLVKHLPKVKIPSTMLLQTHLAINGSVEIDISNKPH